MVFGDDMRGELANKIGATDSGNSMKLLDEGKKEKLEGNHAKSKEIFNQILAATTSRSAHLLEQKQHRAAAEELYIQALTHQQLDDEEKYILSLRQVADSLEAAATTALNFGEDIRGMTSLTLAGLICIKFHDEERGLSIYNNGVQQAESKQNTESLKKLLYSLGYLLDALKNTNMAALNDAQGFISSDLMPMLTSSKLTSFNPLLESITEDTRKIIESKVKMPKVEITTQHPSDVLFNTTYDIIINIENSGEGPAQEMNLEITIPDDIEVLEGSPFENLGVVEASSNVERKFTIRMIAENSVDLEKEITGFVTFVDMLANKRKQSLSPVILEFRSVSKSSEYIDKLTKTLEILNFEDVHPNIPDGLVNSIKELQEKVNTQIKNTIETQQFDQTESGLSILENISNWGTSLLSKSEDEPQLVKDIQRLINEANESLKGTLTHEFELTKSNALQDQSNELTGKFESEKQEIEQVNRELIFTKERELGHLKEELQEKYKKDTEKLMEINNETIKELDIRHVKEKEEAIIQQEETMKEEFEKEKTIIIEAHHQELQKTIRGNENKTKQQLAQMESKLRDEANIDIDKKNDEIEKAIRELQDSHAKELGEVREKLSSALVKKYEAELDSLKVQLQTEEDRITSHLTTDKESALKTQEMKLSKERDDKVQQINTELKSKYEYEMEEETGKLKTEHAKVLLEKENKIKELENKIMIIESRQNQ